MSWGVLQAPGAGAAAPCSFPPWRLLEHHGGSWEAKLLQGTMCRNSPCERTLLGTVLVPGGPAPRHTAPGFGHTEGLARKTWPQGPTCSKCKTARRLRKMLISLVLSSGCCSYFWALFLYCMTRVLPLEAIGLMKTLLQGCLNPKLSGTRTADNQPALISKIFLCSVL